MTFKCLLLVSLVAIFAKQPTSFVDGLPSRINRIDPDNPDLSGSIRLFREDQELVDSFEITDLEHDPEFTGHFRFKRDDDEDDDDADDASGEKLSI